MGRFDFVPQDSPPAIWREAVWSTLLELHPSWARDTVELPGPACAYCGQKTLGPYAYCETSESPPRWSIASAGWVEGDTGGEVNGLAVKVLRATESNKRRADYARRHNLKPTPRGRFWRVHETPNGPRGFGFAAPIPLPVLMECPYGGWNYVRAPHIDSLKGSAVNFP